MAADGVVLHASTGVDAHAAQVTAYLEREAVERNVLLTVIGQANPVSNAVPQTIAGLRVVRSFRHG